MRARSVWRLVLGAALAASFACGGGSKEASTPAAPAAGGQRVDPATAGEGKGVVTLDGPAPANEAIKMNADPVCMREAKGPQYTESYVVGENGKTLANAFVYVKDGLGNYVFDTPSEPAKLDQKDCRYMPHVVGVRVGQPLEIVNSDPTLHNIHAMPKANQEFNNGQPIQGMKMTHTFSQKEVMVPLRCDVHGWMNAYVGVVDNPFYTVTDRDGTFDLKGLPPGTYTIEVWHEKLGRKTESVTVGPKETKDITFTFTPGAPAATPTGN